MIIIRENISTKTTHRPKISPFNPWLKGIIYFTKKYKDTNPHIIVKIIAGNPAGIIQSIQKLPHIIKVLLLTFFSCLVNPACFESSE